MTVSESGSSRFVKADGMTLHFNEVGEGAPVVWIHGGGPGASSWGNFQANMAQFGQGYRNLLFDMPGYGKSDKVAIEEPVLNFNARQIAAALEELGIEKAHFVGNSLGGGTSCRVAIDYPDKVDRLVLMGAAGMMQHSATPTGEMPPGIAVLMEMFGGTIDRDLISRFVTLMCYDKNLVTNEMIEGRLAAALKHHQELVAAGANSAPNLQDLGPDVHRVQSPTLLIWGREDNFVTVEAGVAYARGIQDARLVVVPRCGHWVQYERLELFNGLVSSFFRGELD